MGGGYEVWSTDTLNLDKLSYKQGKLFIQANYSDKYHNEEMVLLGLFIYVHSGWRSILSLTSRDKSFTHTLL